ncbi:MAG: response regulator [Aggregatilineales bacterium]
MTTLLIVEDDMPLGRLFTRALAWDGFVIKHVTSCADAIQFLNQSPVDALLLDMILSDDEGYVVIDHVRAHPTLNAIPIIAMSGHRHYQANLQQQRIDLFLYKPVAAMLLPKLFNRLLNRESEAPHADSSLSA